MSQEFKARKTVYKGIEMRSRLEAGFAKFLDCYKVAWEYEPMAFGGTSGQYLPDFMIPGMMHFVCGSMEQIDTFVDIKPNLESRKNLLQKMEVIFDSRTDCAFLAVYSDTLIYDVGYPNLFFGKNDGPKSWVYGACFTLCGGGENRNGEICLSSRLINPFPPKWWEK